MLRRNVSHGAASSARWATSSSQAHPSPSYRSGHRPSAGSARTVSSGTPGTWTWAPSSSFQAGVFSVNQW